MLQLLHRWRLLEPEPALLLSPSARALVQLVTQCDGNRSAPIRSSVLPSSGRPLPQPQPKEGSPAGLLSAFCSVSLDRARISKESRSPGRPVAAPEAREQRSLLSAACRSHQGSCGIWTPPAGWESGSHGPELLCCPAPPASSPGSEPRTGSHRRRQEAGGGGERWGGGGEEPSFVPGEAKGTKLAGSVRTSQSARCRVPACS